MKKYTILFICVSIFININLFSQSSEEEIIKARNYTTYKLIDRYLASFVKTSNDKKVINNYNSVKNSLNVEFSDDSLSIKKLIILCNKFSAISKSKILENINDLNIANLKTSTPNQISDDLVNKIQSVYDLSNLKIKVDLKDLKSILENELNKIITKRQNSEISNESNSENIDNSVNEEQITNPPSFFSIEGFNIWNFSAILLSLISILLTLLIPKKVIHQSSLSQVQSREKVQSPTQSISFDHIDLERKIRNSEKIKELSNDIYLLKNNPDILNSSNSSVSNQKNENIVTSNDSNLNNSVFYIYRPIENYFSKSNIQNSKKDTLYKFISNSNNRNEASYEIIIDGLSLTPTEIARRNETLIKPACEEENVPGDSVRNIMTKRKGIVVLEGDKWIIKSKALIRYE